MMVRGAGRLVISLAGWAVLAIVLGAASNRPGWAQTSPAGMAGPTRMADSPLGLIVADYVGRGVLILNPNTLAAEDTVPIDGKPAGVAWMKGRVYIGDERSGAIKVYEKPKSTGNNNNQAGVWVQVSPSLTGFPIGEPMDIVADERRRVLFVASKTDKTIYVLDEAGSVLRTIGGPGSTNPVGRPLGLALDHAGKRIFVSDDGGQDCTWMGCTATSSVHVYDTRTGNFLGEISGDTGGAKFNFSRVQGVTVDSRDRVYLVDTWRSQVLVFDEVGANSWTGIGTIGSKGVGVKKLLLSMDVVVDEKSSTVYVTNTMLGRIGVFTFADMVP